MPQNIYLITMGLLLSTVPSFAQNLKDALREAQYSLTGIVDQARSETFACNFGSYQVHLKGDEAGEHLVSIEGKGIVVNSANLVSQAIENGKTLYYVPLAKKIKDGSRLAAFCAGFRTKKEKSGDKMGQFRLDYVTFER